MGRSPIWHFGDACIKPITSTFSINTRSDIAHSRVTVSTVGIVDKIRKLTEDVPEVNLALSLHAPNQEMRSAIVPTAKHFPIEQLIEALDGHMMTFLHRRKEREAAEDNPQNGESSPTRTRFYTLEERVKESSRRRAMIEYIMLEGDTTTLEAAHQLGKLCEGRQLVVNLIPYNQTDVKDKLRCPSEQRVQEFRSIVASYGTFCTIRRTMGADIDSACGQLITLEKVQRDEAVRVGDIEDVASSNHGTHDRMKFSSKTTRRTTAVSATTSSAVNSVSIIGSLAVATTLAATCFVVTTGLFLKQKWRR